MADRKIQAFIKGTHNLFDDEIINDDALSDSLGWITNNGAMELSRGRKLLGDVGTNGTVSDIHIGYKVNGDPVYFKKCSTKVQVLDNDVWTDLITGLTEDAPTSFANYSSLAGAFTYIFSTDGIWKVVTANPTSVITLYDEAVNFKGIGFIDKGRTILWGRKKDTTGLYGSKIDPQNSNIYTTVSAEALSNVSSGTLAFKSGDADRHCFAIELTVTNSGQVFTDDFNGVLTGDQGGTGTINYATGEYTTDDTGAGTVDYQWENSNSGGVTDFRKSTPRVASEGFTFRQDIGGDAIKVVIPLDDIYFSFKENSVYSLAITQTGDNADKDADNNVFRNNVGIPTAKSAIATSKGIVYLDTAQSDNPRIFVLGRNLAGDNFDVQPLFSHFDFTKFSYADAAMFSYGDYVLLTCKTPDGTANDRILLLDILNNTVDILSFQARCFTAKSGNLYSGDSLSTSAYQILNGYDDLEYVINNYMVSKGDTYGSEDLKKVKKLRFRGLISREQYYEVYGSFDRSTYTLLGTVRGDASYVDSENPNTVGLNLIGSDVVGGSDSEVAYPYFCELKIKTPKFRKRYLKFIAKGYGYVSIKSQEDRDIWLFEGRMPKAFRQKQNVSLDGTSTDN